MPVRLNNVYNSVLTIFYLITISYASPGLEIQSAVHPITQQQVWHVEGFVISHGNIYERSSVYISTDPRQNTTFGVFTDTPTQFVTPFATYTATNMTGNIINAWDLAQPELTICNFQKVFLTSPGIAGCITSHVRIELECAYNGCITDMALNGVIYAVDLTLQEMTHTLPHTLKGCNTVVLTQRDREVGIIECSDVVFTADTDTLVISLPLLKGTVELRQHNRKLVYYAPQPSYVVSEGIFVFGLAIWSFSVLMDMYTGHIEHVQSRRSDTTLDHLRAVFQQFEFFNVTIFVTVLSFTIYMVFLTAYNKGDAISHTDLSPYLFEAIIWIHLGVHVMGTVYCNMALIWMLYTNNPETLDKVVGHKYITQWLDRIYWKQSNILERREALLQFLIVFRVLYEYITITGLHFYLSPEFGELARHTLSFTFGMATIFIVGRDTLEIVAYWGVVGICFLASVYAHVNVFMIMPTLPSMLIFPDAIQIHASIVLTLFVYVLSLFIHK